MNRFNVVIFAAVLAFASNAYAMPKECVNVQQLAEHVWSYTFDERCLVSIQAREPRGVWDSLRDNTKRGINWLWSKIPKGEPLEPDYSRSPGFTGVRG